MILVLTGGTGSLSQAILKEQDYLSSHGITKIRVISRDEQKQVFLTRTYEGSIPLDCYLGDVTDMDRMRFALRDAHFVVHTAALKHVEKFASDVKTGFKTNFIGTQNVADAFQESKNAVSGIFVSTDKAVAPITAYGVSKLAAQHVWLWNNSFQKQIKFGVALYGNVWASKGSVIETWIRLAREKKPLPITHSECTRFFTPVDEAAKFVIRTLFQNEKKVHIPEMKASLMKRVAVLIWERLNPGEEPQLIETGFRSIEKLHEVLTDDGLSSKDVPQFTDDELNSMIEAMC